MSEELQTYNEGLPVLADDTLIQIAKQAEARIDAVIKIKQMALKVCNPGDWTDQQGKPYLQASGAEKIANLFNISWRIEEPTMETEADGTITYIYRGQFTLAGRSIEVEGSRSSRDTFFKKYEYDRAGNKTGEKPLDRRDLKMAAMTNLLGNGITRLLGIRNLTWEDLKEYAGINQDMVKGKVEYKNRSKPAGEEPKSKSGNPPPAEPPKDNPPEEPKLSVKDTLSKELSDYCRMVDGEVDANMFASVLKEISAFGDPPKWISDIDKASDKWAGSTLGKLRERTKKAE